METDLGMTTTKTQQIKLPAKENVDRYINEHSAKCPFCSQQPIEVLSSIEFENNMAWMDMYCTICRKIWRDEYKLKCISVMFNHDRWYSDENKEI